MFMLRLPVIGNLIKTRIAHHFARPGRGWFGATAFEFMRKRNTIVNDWILSELDPPPADHLLEIGFGEGLTIQRALRLITTGTISGIDHSLPAVQLAHQHNQVAIQAGRVDLRHGDAADLPFADDSFDKALGVHVVYFWPDPVATLREIHRTLKPGGRLALGTQIKAGMVKSKLFTGKTLRDEVFRLYSNEELCTLLTEAGFREVSTTINNQVGFTAVMTSGIK